MFHVLSQNKDQEPYFTCVAALEDSININMNRNQAITPPLSIFNVRKNTKLHGSRWRTHVNMWSQDICDCQLYKCWPLGSHVASWEVVIQHLADGLWEIHKVRSIIYQYHGRWFAHNINLLLLQSVGPAHLTAETKWRWAQVCSESPK